MKTLYRNNVKKSLFFAFTASLVMLQGCGSHLTGTYSMDGGPIGKASYIFDGSDKVIIDGAGMKSEVTYVLDGKNIKISTPQGTIIYTLLDDKTIEGPMGMKFIKE
jgi:hypothetical protein